MIIMILYGKELKHASTSSCRWPKLTGTQGRGAGIRLQVSSLQLFKRPAGHGTTCKMSRHEPFSLGFRGFLGGFWLDVSRFLNENSSKTGLHRVARPPGGSLPNLGRVPKGLDLRSPALAALVSSQALPPMVRLVPQPPTDVPNLLGGLVAPFETSSHSLQANTSDCHHILKEFKRYINIYILYIMIYNHYMQSLYNHLICISKPHLRSPVHECFLTPQTQLLQALFLRCMPSSSLLTAALTAHLLALNLLNTYFFKEIIILNHIFQYFQYFFHPK